MTKTMTMTEAEIAASWDRAFAKANAELLPTGDERTQEANQDATSQAPDIAATWDHAMATASAEDGLRIRQGSH